MSASNQLEAQPPRQVMDEPPCAASMSCVAVSPLGVPLVPDSRCVALPHRYGISSTPHRCCNCAKMARTRGPYLTQPCLRPQRRLAECCRNAR